MMLFRMLFSRILFLSVLTVSLSAYAQSFSKLRKQAMSAYKLHDFETAKNFGIQALEIRPKDVQTNILVGDAEYFLNNYENALLYYQKVEDKVRHPEMFLRKASVMLALGRDEEALVNYRILAHLKPTDPVFRRLISKVYFDRGDYRGALDEINQAEKLSPLSSPTILGKAQILLKLNRINESCEYLNKPQLTETPEVKILREINCNKEKEPLLQ